MGLRRLVDSAAAPGEGSGDGYGPHRRRGDSAADDGHEHMDGPGSDSRPRLGQRQPPASHPAGPCHSW